jgi:hypothetical protein
MRRNKLLLITIVALQMQGLAQHLDSVQVTLALKDGKTTYRTGEAIVLDLSFTAHEPGYLVETNPSSDDEITISPADGVFSLRGNGYRSDAVSSEVLSPGTASHILLPLNAVYRINKPGHYSVHVTTHRVFRGGTSFEPVQPGLTQEGNTTANATTILTNEVGFDVEAMNEADEEVIAEKLVNEIRVLAEKFRPVFMGVGTQTKVLTQDEKQDFKQEWKHANDLVNELNYLSGDPSTRAKVDAYLHPDVFGPFSTAQGLWIARNRRLVVTLLEQAMKDPSLRVTDIANLTAALKATLTEQSPDQTEQVQRKVELEHLRQIAKTLPERTGENLAETAATLFTQLAQAKQTETPEFAAAREVLITHFSDVSPLNFEGLLNAYGKYLSDPRIVPALEDFLREHQPPRIFGGTRDAVFKQMLILAPPEDVKPFVVDAACDPESRMRFEVLTKLPEDTLPEADQCLLKQIRRLGASEERSAQFELTQKTMLAGRFATKAIYQPMLAVYKQYGSKWLDDARGGMLAYLARYDEKGGLELLKQGIKIGTGQPSNAAMSLCQSFYSPTVNRFFEDELQREDDTQAISWSAGELSEHGTAKDQAMIRARLDRWRKKWAAQGEKPDPEQGGLEGDLILALIHGKPWQIDETEASRLKESCVSHECRDRVKSFGDLVQTAP